MNKWLMSEEWLWAVNLSPSGEFDQVAGEDVGQAWCIQTKDLLKPKLRYGISLRLVEMVFWQHCLQWGWSAAD